MSSNPMDGSTMSSADLAGKIRQGRVPSGGRVTRGTQFPLVQTLRGFAALWVLLFHLVEGDHIPAIIACLPQVVADPLFRWGHFGVPIFFALSGFVIAHSLRDLPLTYGTLGKFVLRRSIRLDPPYWASMVVVIVVAFISAHVKGEVYDFPDASTLLAHLFYLQVVLDKTSLIPAYWTLTYEIQFYLFFATMLTLASLQRWGEKGRRAIWAVMVALAFVSAAHGFDDLHTGIFLKLWASFFAGVLAYKGIEQGWARLCGAALAIVGAVAHDSFMLASVATAHILLVASVTGWAQGRPLLPAGQWLGKISYSLYLLHSTVTGAVAFVLHRVLGHGLIADLATLVAVVAACLLSAYIFWKVIEYPSHQLTRRLKLGGAAGERQASGGRADAVVREGC